MTISSHNAVTPEGVVYDTRPGAQTPTGLNGLLKLTDSDYVDHNGVMHRPEVPGGFLEATYIAWNFTKESLVDYVAVLPEGSRYKVCIYEVVWDD